MQITRPPTDEEIAEFISEGNIDPSLSQVNIRDRVVWVDFNELLEFYDSANPTAPWSSLSSKDQEYALRNGMVGVKYYLGPIYYNDEQLPPPPPPLPAIQDTPLSTLVQVTNTSLSKQYVKHSMVPLGSDTISFKNLSTTVPINVKLTNISGIISTPQNFTLLPNGTQDVSFTYNIIEINKFNEGTVMAKTVVSLTTNVS